MIHTFNLSVPKDWQSLSDSQLQYFFTQLSHDLPMEEILTLCLFKWADLRVLCKTHNGSYLVKQRHAPKHETTLTIRQVQAATASLEFLRQFAPLPVRITKIGRATAIATDFQGVPFSTFISADNYYQGFLHTKNEALLSHLATLLYPKVKKSQLTTPLLLNAFYWFSSLKHNFARLFPALPAADVQFFRRPPGLRTAHRGGAADCHECTDPCPHWWRHHQRRSGALYGHMASSHRTRC